MGNNIGLLLIHGAGEATFKQQEKFVKKLTKQLKRKKLSTSSFYFEHVDWYKPTQQRQDALLNRMNHAGFKMRAKALRRFTVGFIGDVAAYGGLPDKPCDGYAKTHAEVYKSIQNLEQQCGNNAQMVVVASSLGAEIISNYIWDRQHADENDPFGKTPFQRFETTPAIFMFGNNAPLFACSLPIDDLRPIQFPDENLDGNLKELAIWENYYDKNDPLGFPLTPINQHYKDAIIKDIQINVGGLLAFWNPLSHLKYWLSKKIIKRIACYLQQLTSV